MTVRNLQAELRDAQAMIHTLKRDIATTAIDQVEALPEPMQKLLAVYGLNRLMELGIDRNMLAPRGVWDDLIGKVNSED